MSEEPKERDALVHGGPLNGRRMLMRAQRLVMYDFVTDREVYYDLLHVGDTYWLEFRGRWPRPATLRDETPTDPHWHTSGGDAECDICLALIGL